MHSKECYKICTCSVILGELESFRKQGLLYYFAENFFRCNLTYYESENFSDSSLHYIFFNPKILGFLFVRKIALPGQ